MKSFQGRQPLRAHKDSYLKGRKKIKRGVQWGKPNLFLLEQASLFVTDLDLHKKLKFSSRLWALILESLQG